MRTSATAIPTPNPHPHPTPTQENVYHRGPARCFDEENQAYEAVLAGKVLKGDVLVVRYEGPKGAPGGHQVGVPAPSLLA